MHEPFIIWFAFFFSDPYQILRQARHSLFNAEDYLQLEERTTV